MPLLHIVSCTNINTTFVVSYAFLKKESTEDYIWAMKSLKGILEQLGFVFPSVIITDQELALINTVYHVFPLAKWALCIWYVEKNVFSKAGSFFGEKEDDKQDEFMKAWARVLSSGSRLDYEDN